MGQFSEQILALMEAHARGDLASEEFEARIRDLVGAVSPEAVARHPGRLTLVHPTIPQAGPAPAPAPSAPAPSPAVEEPAAPAILDGVTGFEPLPDFSLEAAPDEPAALPEPSSPPAAEPVAAPVSAAEPVLELDSSFLDEPAPAPASPAAEPVSEEPATPAILDGVTGFEPLPDFDLEETAAEEPRPARQAVPEARAATPPPVPAPESSLVLDGVSGYEHLLSPEPGEAPAAAPHPAPPGAGPAAATRQRKAPPKVVVVPSTPPPPQKKTDSPAASAPEAKPASPAKPAAAGAAKPAAGAAKPPPPGRARPAGRPGSVVVSGRAAGEADAISTHPVTGFEDQMFGNGGPGETRADYATSFVSSQVRRDLKEKTTWKSPGKAALLSLLLPGVGDFYLGKVANGLVFYLVFFILLMLVILRGDLVLAGALAVLAVTSAGSSWLGANKHNDAIHRIQDAPSLQRKTRETTFTYGNTRRR